MEPSLNHPQSQQLVGRLTFAFSSKECAKRNKLHINKRAKQLNSFSEPVPSAFCGAAGRPTG